MSRKLLLSLLTLVIMLLLIAIVLPPTRPVQAAAPVQKMHPHTGVASATFEPPNKVLIRASLLEPSSGLTVYIGGIAIQTGRASSSGDFYSEFGIPQSIQAGLIDISIFDWYYAIDTYIYLSPALVIAPATIHLKNTKANIYVSGARDDLSEGVSLIWIDSATGQPLQPTLSSVPSSSGLTFHTHVPLPQGRQANHTYILQSTDDATGDTAQATLTIVP